MTNFIKEVRASKNGSLTGLSFDDIVGCVTQLVNRKESQVCNGNYFTVSVYWKVVISQLYEVLVRKNVKYPVAAFNYFFSSSVFVIYQIKRRTRLLS